MLPVFQGDSIIGGSKGISVVLPCLNEARTIGDVVWRLKGYHVIVVDGGSTDGSQALAKNAGAAKVIKNIIGAGNGYRRGFEESKSKYVAFLDADGTYYPEDLPRALEAAISQNADAVFGERFSKKGNHMRLPRKIGNLAVTFFLNMLFGVNLPDSQSGFFIVKKTSAKKMPSSDSYPFVQELKLGMYALKCKCVWMSIRYSDRDSGSKFNFFIDGFSLAVHALKLRFGMV